MGISRKSPSLGINGSGVIVRVKFRVSGNVSGSQKVRFSLSNVKANNSNGGSIILTPLGSTSEIGSGMVVWPGDTNNDGIVNQSDILPLGLYWGATGSSRNNASLKWEAQSANPWSNSKATYADATGDGVVNQAEISAIGLNCNKQHSGSFSKPSTSQADLSINGQLQLVSSANAYRIKLLKGNELEDVIGLSFTLRYKTNIKDVSFNSGKYFGENVIKYYNKVNNVAGYSIVQKANCKNLIDENEFIAELHFAFNNDAEMGCISIENVEAMDKTGKIFELQGFTADVINTSLSKNRMSEYNLSQNYPNPFNPTTTISYTVPTNVSGKVTLKVYDVLGNEIATLVDEQKQSGIYEVLFDGSNFSSGIYFYKITINEFSDMKKLILIK